MIDRSTITAEKHKKYSNTQLFLITSNKILGLMKNY